MPLFKPVLITLLIISTGCSVATAPSLPEFSIKNESRLHFSGKGAGAGLMLMSAMGPMGIAIGVAIDEGIAKDIAQAAQQGDVEINQIVRDVLIQNKSVWTLLEDSVVTINRYGFLVAPGGGDQVMPQLHLSIARGEQQLTSFRFPEDYPDNTVPKAELSRVKQQPQVIDSLWRKAAQQLFK